MKSKQPVELYNAWELIHEGSYVLASRFIERLKANEVAKQGIRRGSNVDPTILLCGYCRTPVHYVERTIPEPNIFIRHSPAKDDLDKLEKHKGCPFCSLDKVKDFEQIFYRNIPRKPIDRREAASVG